MDKENGLIDVEELTKKQRIELHKRALLALPSFLLKPGPQFANVRLVDLSENEIADIPGTFFSQLPSVESLSLQYNQLTILHFDIGIMQNVTTLRLDQNNLTCLPTSVGNLKKLSFLSVSRNRLASLPSSICNLKALRVLNISENLLLMLPLDLGDLTDLEELYIYHNKLVSIPTSLWKLHRLEGFSFEWFRYASPPLPTHFRGALFQALRDQVRELLKQLYDNQMRECAFAAFVACFSEDEFSFDRVMPDSHKVPRRYIGRSMLQISVMEGDLGVLDALLPLKPDLNAVDGEGYSALGLALREGNIAAAKKILDMHPNVRVGHGPAGSPVHMAVKLYEAELSIELIRQGARVYSMDANGNAPLHLLFAYFDKFPIKAGLIADAILGAAGGDPNIRNVGNYGAVHVAAEKGQIEGIKWMVAYNRQHHGDKQRCFDLDLQGGNEQLTAMHIASCKGYYRVIQELLAGRASTCLPDAENETPRCLARSVTLISKMLRKAESREIKERIFACEESGEGGDVCETRRGVVRKETTYDSCMEKYRPVVTVATTVSTVATPADAGDSAGGTPSWGDQGGKFLVKGRGIRDRKELQARARKVSDPESAGWERYAALGQLVAASGSSYCAVRSMLPRLETLPSRSLQVDVVYAASVTGGRVLLQGMWNDIKLRPFCRALKAEMYYDMEAAERPARTGNESAQKKTYLAEKRRRLPISKSNGGAPLGDAGYFY